MIAVRQLFAKCFLGFLNNQKKGWYEHHPLQNSLIAYSDFWLGCKASEEVLHRSSFLLR